MKLKILFFALLLPLLAFPQKVTVSGYVEDASTGERLIGAAVFDTLSHKYGTFTNEYGYFSLTVPAKKSFPLRITYIGYKPLDTVLDLTKDVFLTFKLHSATVLKEVVVTGYYNELKSTQTGRIDLPVQKVVNLPVIFGEADLMKTLQLLPGVQSGTEGTSGLYVRGGGPDQNLILLDGVPLYNISHMAGFFSVFTPEAIKDVSLYKSGFPARFGGRLSSVIDVHMKDGNMKKYTGSVSVGLISSKFTFEGPTVKDKGSFIIAARRTYFDLLTRPLFAVLGTYEDHYEDAYYKEQFSAGYYFYDVYAKINHKITPKDRIYLSFYSGLDKAFIRSKYIEQQIETDSTYPSDSYSQTDGSLMWGNNILAFKWNHAFNKNLFVNTTLTYSKFLFSTTATYEDYWNWVWEDIDGTVSHDVSNSFFDLGYRLGINDLAANTDFSYTPNVKHNIRFGFQAIHHQFNPGQIYFRFGETDLSDGDTMYNESFDTTYSNQLLSAPEFGAYFEDDFDVTNWLKVNLGFRVTSFDVRTKNYYSFEPRVSARVLLGKNLSLKASYAQMTQYLHFVTNNTVGIPLDLWLPATDRVVPEKSWQAAGALTYVTPQKVTLSAEVFYKDMQNIVEIKEGESIFSISLTDLDKSWEDKVSQGHGWAYGGELFLRKDFGKLTGWFAYTLSWSWRQFDDINNGIKFPFKYDRRHDLSIALNYKLSDRILLGAVWVYGSGTPITIAQSEYMPPFESGFSCINYDCAYNGIQYYGGRNGYRLPSYQRLDLSLNFNKERKHGTRTWTLGLYNAYNHVNPFFTQTVYDWQTKSTVLRAYSLFPVMPFVSYRFTWK